MIFNSKQSELWNQHDRLWSTFFWDNLFHTAGNAKDLLQVMDFTGLLQVVNKSVDFIKLQQICENQTWFYLILAGYFKLVDKKSWQSTCSKQVDNLQQTCYHQVGASDANASWCQLDDSKATSLQQTCCNLRIFGRVDYPNKLRRH